MDFRKNVLFIFLFYPLQKTEAQKALKDMREVVEFVSMN